MITSMTIGNLEVEEGYSGYYEVSGEILAYHFSHIPGFYVEDLGEDEFFDFACTYIDNMVGHVISTDYAEIEIYWD